MSICYYVGMKDPGIAGHVKEALKDVFTLSKSEMERVAKERVSEIDKEFTSGFSFLEDYPRSVTFFGSTMFNEGHPYYEDAKALAARIATELNYSVATGGGPGIMEAANRGAYEAGGKSVGHLIQLPHEQPTNKYMTAHATYYYFFVRKVCLAFSAEAFIFYPGGFGTLDEFFEILTLIQTRKIRGVPLICVGTDYWLEIKRLMQNQMLERGAITVADLNLFTITDSHDRIIETIKGVPLRANEIYNDEVAAI